MTFECYTTHVFGDVEKSVWEGVCRVKMSVPVPSHSGKWTSLWTPSLPFLQSHRSLARRLVWLGAGYVDDVKRKFSQ